MSSITYFQNQAANCSTNSIQHH